MGICQAYTSIQATAIKMWLKIYHCFIDEVNLVLSIDVIVLQILTNLNYNWHHTNCHITNSTCTHSWLIMLKFIFLMPALLTTLLHI